MSNERPTLSRRAALKWFAGSAAATAAAPVIAATNETEAAPMAYPARFPLHDPDYMKAYVAPWQNVLTKEELETTKVLADIILPKDDQGPAASEVGVPEFINEWISAPYDSHRETCELVRGGLGWLNLESSRRFEKSFVDLSGAQQIAIVDDICDDANSKPEHKIGSHFFKKFRQLCLGGYYTHSATWKQLGYVGNISLGGPYPGVPEELIKRLGLEDVV